MGEHTMTISIIPTKRQKIDNNSNDSNHLFKLVETPVRHRKLLRDSIDGVTRPAIRRMARRGGVKRLASLSYKAVRSVLRQFLHRLLHDVVAYTGHGKRKTVLPQDVI